MKYWPHGESWCMLDNIRKWQPVIWFDDVICIIIDMEGYRLEGWTWGAFQKQIQVLKSNSSEMIYYKSFKVWVLPMHFKKWFFYTPHVSEVERGWFHVVHLSIHPSVRLSIRLWTKLFLLCIFHNTSWIYFIFYTFWIFGFFLNL